MLLLADFKLDRAHSDLEKQALMATEICRLSDGTLSWDTPVAPVRGRELSAGAHRWHQSKHR